MQSTVKLFKSILTVVGLTVAVIAGAQSQGQMRLNEYLVINTDDYQDDYGQQSAWIEIFNASYGTVDIGGCYLSDDPSNLKKYQIPGGDILTKIKPRQHVIFWADNQPYRGTFHVNFDLLGADEIIFTKGDGKSIIDRIKVEPALKDSTMANRSYGRLEDGVGSITGDGEGWVMLERTSASTNNAMVDKTAKPQRMKEMDPYGWMMAVLAMSVVFLALIILYFIFKQISKIYTRPAKTQDNAKNTAAASSAPAAPADSKGSEDEINAAIVAALEMWMESNQLHDEESFVLTIAPSHSAWNDKHELLTKLPRMK